MTNVFFRASYDLKYDISFFSQDFLDFVALFKTTEEDVLLTPSVEEIVQLLEVGCSEMKTSCLTIMMTCKLQVLNLFR